ncbi:MAG: hypothetical protein GX942_02165 [Papillibacter sp.]|jgi:hypothetical protein|nr:hypothetical protein [Papillibacter sp.]
MNSDGNIPVFPNITSMPQPDYTVSGDGVKCENVILCSQAKVSVCEAQLFCTASERLVCELNKAKNVCEIKMIVEIINSLLKSSAEKELAFAEIIKAAHAKDSEDCDLCPEDDD